MSIVHTDGCTTGFFLVRNVHSPFVSRSAGRFNSIQSRLTWIVWSLALFIPRVSFCPENQFISFTNPSTRSALFTQLLEIGHQHWIGSVFLQVLILTGVMDGELS